MCLRHRPSLRFLVVVRSFFCSTSQNSSHHLPSLIFPRSGSRYVRSRTSVRILSRNASAAFFPPLSIGKFFAFWFPAGSRYRACQDPTQSRRGRRSPYSSGGYSAMQRGQPHALLRTCRGLFCALRGMTPRLRLWGVVATLHG